MKEFRVDMSSVSERTICVGKLRDDHKSKFYRRCKRESIKKAWQRISIYHTNLGKEGVVMEEQKEIYKNENKKCDTAGSVS